MRQERITSYQDLEARVKFLEQSIALFCEWKMEHKKSFETLHEFLSKVDGNETSNDPEA